MERIQYYTNQIELAEKQEDFNWEENDIEEKKIQNQIDELKYLIKAKKRSPAQRVLINHMPGYRLKFEIMIEEKEREIEKLEGRIENNNYIVYCCSQRIVSHVGELTYKIRQIEDELNNNVNF